MSCIIGSDLDRNCLQNYLASGASQVSPVAENLFHNRASLPSFFPPSPSLFLLVIHEVVWNNVSYGFLGSSLFSVSLGFLLSPSLVWATTFILSFLLFHG